jgi:hypothetical protein
MNEYLVEDIIKILFGSAGCIFKDYFNISLITPKPLARQKKRLTKGFRQPE